MGGRPGSFTGELQPSWPEQGLLESTVRARKMPASWPALRRGRPVEVSEIRKGMAPPLASLPQMREGRSALCAMSRGRRDGVEISVFGKTISGHSSFSVASCSDGSLANVLKSGWGRAGGAREGAWGGIGQKNEFPNFFCCKLLIFLNRAKNKFGKVWSGRGAVIENIDVFLSCKCRNRAVSARSWVFASDGAQLGGPHPT